MAPPSSLRLVLVGEGRERPRIEAACRRLGVAGMVTLVGHQDDVQPYYGIADVFVLPSHSEGSPNVLLEAMAAGLPVVATSVGGVPELAVNGRDAILVDKGDISGLAAAIDRILADTHLSEHLACAARGVLSRNKPEAYFRSILAAFQEVL